SPEGRLWSAENVWPLYTWPPEPEGESERASGVEYIRSDLHDAEIARLTRELEAEREQVRALREALSAALDRASEGETRAERCRPGQSGGLRAIFGRWPGDETDEEIREWLERES